MDATAPSTTWPAPCTPCQITFPWWSARYGHSRPPNPSVQCRARSNRPSPWVASTIPSSVAASDSSSNVASVPLNVVGGAQPAGPSTWTAASQ